jgi:putative oxidoreductase
VERLPTPAVPDPVFILHRKERSMKIVVLIARILLGLMFFVFGLNKFYPFIPAGPLPTGVAGQFMGALVSTKYIMIVGAFETIGGLLLLINRFVPLALCLLGPVIVNVLIVGVLLTQQALGPGLVVAALWMLLFLRFRGAFAGIFQARA